MTFEGRQQIARSVVILSAYVLFGVGCTQETISVDVRSLEHSGRSAFVCLDAPTLVSGEPNLTPGRRITDCTRVRGASPSDFAVDANGNTTLPHIYALITQTTRGEVAVVDLSTNTDAVLDQNQSLPGHNFLPVGAQPIDIVATQGGTAAFVSVAEVGHEGIFALPTTMIRPLGSRPPPSYTSWPACRLPSPPGDMILVDDLPSPTGEGERFSCDTPYGELDPNASGQHGNLADEGFGRQKLIVAMPELGGFAVFDAQELLDREPGSFEPCGRLKPVDTNGDGLPDTERREPERWIPLQVNLPPPVDNPPPPPTAGCVNPASPTPSAQPIASPRPSGLAFASNRLYVADLDAPVIHVIDMATPCDPVEREPLLPISIDEPSRVVTTSHLAVGRSTTPEFKRYLYAVDAQEGSLIPFDISDDSTQTTPLLHSRSELNPFQPPDRILFSAPIRDLVVVDRDAPASHPATGVAPEGIRCSPDPNLTVCDASTATCDVETLYRTIDGFKGGAGPLRLRGTFAFALLTSGQVAIIDIDDLDAACRGPKAYTSIFGCPPFGFDPLTDETTGLATSGEASCNVFVPNTARSAVYIATNDTTGRNEPGLQLFPLVYDPQGTLLPFSEETTPKMRATLPADNSPLAIAVGGGIEAIDNATGFAMDNTSHALAMNLEDPRVHLADQEWAVVWEGALLGSSGNAAELRLNGDDNDGLYDSTARFCSHGVQSAFSLDEQQLNTANADIVQITSDLPAEESAYWIDRNACSFQQCQGTFGTVQAPNSSRDLRIREAFEDHVLVDQPQVDRELLKCCFSGSVQFTVRGKNQWIVASQGLGFLHHVIADPATGACRNSCDPRQALLNSRILMAPPNQAVPDGDPLAFKNAMFRFAITAGSQPPLRDTQFRFITQGSYRRLFINLVVTTLNIQPTSIRQIPATGELAITDGSLEGLILLSLDFVDVSRQFY